MATEELQNGRYHRVRLLGSGGMGEVFLMQDTRVNRQVAIKVIRTEGVSGGGRSGSGGSSTGSDANRLFQREAKAIAALEHPNILPLYDFGEEVRDGDTMTYMVMQFCPDGSLQDWWRQRASQIVPAQDIAFLLEQAADALQYAHEQSVIHLDVKPSNFLLRTNKRNPDRPMLLLADFGIARNFATVASSSHTIRGTPTSMAPEQWASKPAFATDQYALAVMAFELLTGRPPFTGSMEQLMYQHFQVPPPAPSAFNPLLPAAVDKVILRALSKKPEERYATVTDFAAAFTEAAKQAPIAGDRLLKGSDARAFSLMMAITQEEADVGLSRLLTLPGGQQVSVSIPAGAADGQVIHVPVPAHNGDAADELSAHETQEMLLTLTVNKPPDSQPVSRPISEPVSQPVSEYETVLTKSPESDPDLSSRKLFDPASDHGAPTIATASSIGPVSSVSRSAAAETPAPASRKPGFSRLGVISLVSIVVVLVLIASTVLIIFTHQHNSNPVTANSVSHQSSPTASAKASPTTAPTPSPTPQNGLYIAGSYNGSMFDQNTQQNIVATVYIVQTQGNGKLQGSVTFKSPTQGVYPLNGTVDMKGNFSFTVQQPGKTPLYLFGSLQQSSFLKGNYCSSSTGPCLSITGYFTFGPRS